MNAIQDKLNNNRNQLGRYYHLFMIMFLNGTRISETLNLSYLDIIDTGQVFMHADKGSRNRLLTAGDSAEYLIKCKRNLVNPFFMMNRFQAYRMLKNLNISVLKKGRVNESVTHAFKNEYTKRLRGLNLDNKELSNLTGHKVAKNVEYYGKD